MVLRGDIGTGKSALLKRLRGGGFSAAYEPRHARARAGSHASRVLRVAFTPPLTRSLPRRARTPHAHSAQIATAKIAWKCAAEPDDVISVDVWDVVDRCAC